MPELPDIAILADALDVALGGRPLTGSKIAQSLVLRGTPAELTAFEGQTLLDVTRRGKFLVLRFERDRMIFNPMLTGRLGVVTAGEKAWGQWAAMFEFGAAVGKARRHKWPAANAALVAAARPGRRTALSRRDPDGQDLPDAGGRRAAGGRVG